MDVGVGSMVFSAGLVAAKPSSSSLMSSVKRSAPLLLMGIGRTLSIKATEYQVKMN